MSKLVAYYSKDGNTREVARMTADKMDARLYEIVDSSKRNGVFGFMKSGFQAIRKKRAKIDPIPDSTFEGVTEVYIATPLWASMPSPAANAFVDQAPLRGVTVHIITVQADPDHSGSQKAYESLMNSAKLKGAVPGKHFAFTGNSPGKPPLEESIKNQVDEKI